MNQSDIAVVLPAREGFGPSAFGAVSLSVKDFIYNSRYRDRFNVFGLVDAPAYEGIDYTPLPLKRHWYETKTRAYARALHKQFTQHPPALIEVHNRPKLARMLARLGHGPIALHLHNDPQEMKAASSPRARTQLLREIDAVYCISDYIHTRMVDGITIDHSHVHTVHSGLDIPPQPERKQPAILFVGRMTPNKGGREFVQAMQHILQQNKGWRAEMIGGRRHSVSTDLSPYEREIMEGADAVGNAMHFLGFCDYDTTMHHMHEAAILVVPSLWHEPYGRTALEGIAHGCAVITAGYGGLPEIVGDAGICLPVVTPDSIATAVQSLIDDAEKLQAMQMSAYVHAQGFSIERCAQRLDDIRHHVLNDQEDARDAA
ncbi:MAG: hypothetical protein CMM94_07695 [Rickettsiales bacterium]|nr:hypothetical protein [Rickettsiales bacterium]